MYLGKRILAVVPARSGSKGIRDKNYQVINGHSLIAWAGKILSKIKWIDARVISTDSEKYAIEGKSNGLNAPFMRPGSLSQDKTGAIETMQHALIESEKHFAMTFDVILIVEPTSPLRTPYDIEESVSKLVESRADSVVTVSPLSTKSHPHKIFKIKNKRLAFFDPQGTKIKQRQELIGGLYWRNGFCYALTRSCLMDKNAVITDNTVPLVSDRPVANIDDKLDLEWAEFLMKRNQKQRY